MSTLGLIGVVLIVLGLLVAAVQVVTIVRRRSAAARRPRTVADLVKMRSEQDASEPVAEAAPDATTTAATAQPTAPAVPAARSEPNPAVAVARTVPASAVPAAPLPITAIPAAAIPHASVAAPPARRETSGYSDTPWGRAARIAEGGRQLWADPSSKEPDAEMAGWTDRWEEPAVPEPPAEVPSPAADVDDEPAPAAAPAAPEAVESTQPTRPTQPAESPEPPEVEPSTERSTSPMVRPRLTDEEAAAEQEAADRSLLRTFGFAEATEVAEPVQAIAPVIPLNPPAAAQVVEASDGEEKLRVVFRVVGRDHAGVPGAAVALLDDHGREKATSSTSADGSGTLVAPHPGSYVLVATADGFEPGAVAVTVADPDTSAEILLTRSASLSGTVFGEDGEIVGARVTLSQDGEIVDAVNTDQEGAYRVTGLAAGEYSVSVAAHDCETVTATVEVGDESAVVHNVDLEPAGVPPVPTGGDPDDAMLGRH
ncbi:carboxypeptidase-like regulatory domain-containing protein [Actinomycetes bacterium KLBMP 9759]